MPISKAQMLNIAACLAGLYQSRAITHDTLTKLASLNKEALVDSSKLHEEVFELYSNSNHPLVKQMMDMLLETKH